MQVRSLAILGSGWHPPLFREEARALLGPIEVLHQRMAFFTQSDEVIGRISEASLIDEALNSTSRLLSLIHISEPTRLLSIGGSGMCM